MPSRALPAQNLPCIIIPARHNSTRFPGKPLARLHGAGGVGRSLIEWTWRAAQRVPGVGTVTVATDDRRIVEEVDRFGGTAILTPSDCANGTERCAAALESMAYVPDVIVNFQGDAPLTPPKFVVALIRRMQSEPALCVATPAIRCSASSLQHLIDDRAAGRVGGTTLVFDAEQRALYFSKNILPFVGAGVSVTDCMVFMHLGVYAYRTEALKTYVACPPSGPEIAEGLEQLRFLHMGVGVGAVVCEPPEGPMIELNNPTDAALIEDELQRRRL